ncbi:MAG: hypothetical protein ACOYU7_01745 [Bacillota bacterium]
MATGKEKKRKKTYDIEAKPDLMGAETGTDVIRDVVGTRAAILDKVRK